MLLYEYLPILKFCRQKREESKGLVLATIIGTNGSSYRKKWTTMVLAEDGSYAGALSGGCVERDVIRNAAKIFFTKKSISFEYDGYNSLGCNGTIYVLLEYLNSTDLDRIDLNIEKCKRERKSFKRIIVKNITNNTFATGFRFGNINIFVSKIEEELIEEQIIFPDRRLIIFGNEIDGYALNTIASQIGFDCYSVISPRAVKPKKAITKYIVGEAFNIDEVVPLIDAYTYILLMTHSKEKDALLLPQLIPLDYLYLGILGPESRKKEITKKAISVLKQSSNTASLNKIDKIYGPIGVDIGATNPEEISISILGQLIAVSPR